MDEAASKLRTEIDSLPVELDEAQRRIMQLEIEREALRKEKDTVDRRSGWPRLERELAERKEARHAVSRRSGSARRRRSRPRRTSAGRPRRGATRDRRGAAHRRLCPGVGAAVRTTSRAGAAAGQRRRPAARDAVTSPRASTRMLKEEVDEDDIAEVVSKWTHIPISKLLEGEIEKLVQMEDRLRQSRGRPGRRGRVGVQRHPTCARPVCRIPTGPWGASSSWAPRGSGKTELSARAGRVPVRRRAGDDPHRHVRVPGEAHGLTA